MSVELALELARVTGVGLPAMAELPAPGKAAERVCTASLPLSRGALKGRTGSACIPLMHMKYGLNKEAVAAAVER